MRLRALLLVLALLFSSTSWAVGCHPQLHSNVGCDFYAVSLPNPLAAQAEQMSSVNYDYAVGVHNTSSTSASSITISGGALFTPLVIPLAAGASQSVVLPKVYVLWQSVGTKLVRGGAYHVVATSPISAVQYNTINPAAGANDASLLLPMASAGTSFRALVWPTEILDTALPGQLGIVATRSGTTVQVQASGAVFQVGAGLTASGGTISLDAGDVVVLSSSSVTGSDSSGALITSDAPILVWTSHAAAQVPVGSPYADYMEEMLPSISALGSDYFVARPKNPAGTAAGASQYVKLVATVDDTNLIFDPSIPGAPTTLQAGAAATFVATQDFHLHSDHAILVAQFMESGGVFGSANTYGDPSETITVPTDQAQTSVDFYAPQAFSPNYAQIIAPTGTTVTVGRCCRFGFRTLGKV